MSQKDKEIQWKNVGIILVGLLIFWIILGSINGGSSFNQYGHMGGYYANTGFNFEGFLVSLISLAVKVLWILLLVGLLVGLYFEAKKHLFDNDKVSNFDLNPLIAKFTGSENDYDCPSCGQKIGQEFKFCPSCKVSLKNQCVNCGKELLAGWNCCPCCGAENKKGDDSHE